MLRHVVQLYFTVFDQNVPNLLFSVCNIYSQMKPMAETLEHAVSVHLQEHYIDVQAFIPYTITLT